MNQSDIRVLCLTNGKVNTTLRPQLGASTLHLGNISLRNARFATRSNDFDLEVKVTKMKTEVGCHHSLTTTSSKPWWKRIGVKL
ncbi:unnamed protein product [Heligmosomoides polygyrus]|uniref:Recep_L_domain domain-containing protein n=1 Tax=Heligmosomoides polygyrus TaxID=6339 RepID=A0A183FTV6_HELPZ|nr:unnamed protein product [Heligmosomoides polygyrus]